MWLDFHSSKHCSCITIHCVPYPSQYVDYIHYLFWIYGKLISNLVCYQRFFDENFHVIFEWQVICKYNNLSNFIAGCKNSEFFRNPIKISRTKNVLGLTNGLKLSKNTQFNIRHARASIFACFFALIVATVNDTNWINSSVSLHFHCNYFHITKPCRNSLGNRLNNIVLYTYYIVEFKIKYIEPNLFFLNRSNLLTSLPRELCFLPIEVLLVSNNRLVALPDELGRMEQLTELDAACNQITHLPARMSDLKNLKSLSLRNNQLVYLPRGKKNKQFFLLYFDIFLLLIIL